MDIDEGVIMAKKLSAGVMVLGRPEIQRKKLLEWVQAVAKHMNFQFITRHRQVSSYYRNEIEIAHKNRKRTRTFIDKDGRFCKIAKTTD